MVKKITAKEVHTMANSAQMSAGTGPVGACLVVRHRPRTQVTCYEITEAACNIIDRKLWDDGHTRFMGEGTNCGN